MERFFMGGKYLSFIALFGLLVVATEPANARDAVKSGTIERNGSKFSYRVIVLTSKTAELKSLTAGRNI
ncbi:hypothetical protein [Rhizobium etli]|uniref:hypothetical protein n=1 Tax=Rhizobium etli TaxID=29449 RepID=UPI001FD8AB8B|nr:hypothetical protein [Rhizobium sp. IE4771]